MTKKRHVGLTLIEVLVALVVITIAISMFLYFADALRLTRISKVETEAAAYTRNYLDTLRSIWQLEHNYKYKLDAAEPQNLPEGYEAKVTISNESGGSISPSTSSDLSALRTVTISLTDRQGKVYEMTTQIARPLLEPSQ